MATVYKIKLTSHWINYNEKELAKKIKELERKLEYQKRWNDEMYNLTKRMCKRLDKIEAVLLLVRVN